MFEKLRSKAINGVKKPTEEIKYLELFEIRCPYGDKNIAVTERHDNE